MKLQFPRMLWLVAAAALVAACGSGAGAAQGPETALAQLANQATVRARSAAPDAALRQLDIDWASGRHIFRFTDSGATREIAVTAPTASTPASQWPAESTTVSPLANRRPLPSLDLASLRVSPAEAAQSMQQTRADVRVRTLTLVGENSDLVWYVFGDVSQGSISGKMSSATRAFALLGPGRPVQPPTIATP